MYTINVEAVSWRDDAELQPDKKNCFYAAYIIDDGFTTIQDAKDGVRKFDLNTRNFVYLFFKRQWYAIHLKSYIKNIIITKEAVHYKENASYINGEDCSHEEFKEYLLGRPKFCIMQTKGDNKKWQDGIIKDFLLVDKNIKVYDHNFNPISFNSILSNNVIITFGTYFFVNEICINQDEYVSRVFSHYYSDNSLFQMRRKVRVLRRKEYQYFNPFNGETSKTEDEEVKKRNKLLKENGLRLPKPKMNPWNSGDTKQAAETEKEQEEEEEMKKIKDLNELEALVGQEKLRRWFLEYMVITLYNAEEIENLQNGRAVMGREELEEFVRNVGRQELYDELEERQTKRPRYFKAIQATLLALGYDEKWVYGDLLEALQDQYL